MAAAYFDVNATAPIDPRVGEEVRRVTEMAPGNPSSAHGPGREARAVLEDARERIAARLGAKPREIVFTSGGTEANNHALFGIARRSPEGHLLVSAVEHPSVLRAAERLERDGRPVTKLAVDPDGRPDPEAFSDALRPESALCSVMLANNETGAILPVAELASRAHERGILFHTDAVQAVGRIPVRVDDLGVDLLTAGAHKLGGPRGVGLLYVRSGTPLPPWLAGGSQEHGLRPGTVPVALAAGFATALDLAVEEMVETSRRVSALRDRLSDGIASAVPDSRRLTPEEGALPNTLSMTFRGVSGEALLIALDREGFAVATGSACASGSSLPSHVLTAMGLPRQAVTASIRLSLGPQNRSGEVERFLELLPPIVDRLRRLSGG